MNGHGDADEDWGGYYDDSGEWVRLKDTAFGGHRGPRDRENQAHYEMVRQRIRDFNDRFPDGCWIQLPGQRIQVLNIISDASTQIVRYHVAGDYSQRTKRLHVHRMTILLFLKMVGNAKAEGL